MGRVAWRSDAGYIAGAEAVPFGVLILVVGALIVANLWAVLDTRMAVSGAAREGARAVAEADNADDARARAEEAAGAALGAHGRTFTGTVHLTEGWRPCAPITVTVIQPVRLIRIPLVGALARPSTDVSSVHSEVVDPFRSRPGWDSQEEVVCE